MLNNEKEQSLAEMWSDYPLENLSWVCHLRSTLFFEKGTKHWRAIEKKTVGVCEGRFLAYGSTRKCQRVFVCQCVDGGAFVTGHYAQGDNHDAARDSLSRLVIGQPAQESLKC